MRERGYLESWGTVACWRLLPRLKQPVVAEHWLVLHGVRNHLLGLEGRVQPRQPGVALIACSFCAAWRKVSSQLLVLVLGLKHALGERNLRERGGVWGAVEWDLGRMEGGSLQREGGAER